MKKWRFLVTSLLVGMASTLWAADYQVNGNFCVHPSERSKGRRCENSTLASD